MKMIKANITSKGKINSIGDLICYSNVDLPKTKNMGYNTYDFLEKVEITFDIPNEFLNLDTNAKNDNYTFYKHTLEIIQPNGISRFFTTFNRTIAVDPNNKFLTNGIKDTYCI